MVKYLKKTKRIKLMQLSYNWESSIVLIFVIMTKSPKAKYGIKCILSYNVPVHTIISPYDANCVTPLTYPTTDLAFLFWIIVSCDLSFYIYFLKPSNNLFINGIIPPLLLQKLCMYCTLVHVHVCIFYFHSLRS